MIKIEIPGFRHLRLSNLVLDYNGTVAFDGRLISGVEERLKTLSEHLQVHVITADTFGDVEERLSGIACRLYVIPKEEQARAKEDYVRHLGDETCVCIGNGRNDRLMLKNAALGMAVLQAEGGAVEALMAADVVVPNILDALDLLSNPRRLTATLRS